MQRRVQVLIQREERRVQRRETRGCTRKVAVVLNHRKAVMMGRRGAEEVVCRMFGRKNGQNGR